MRLRGPHPAGGLRRLRNEPKRTKRSRHSRRKSHYCNASRVATLVSAEHIQREDADGGKLQPTLLTVADSSEKSLYFQSNLPRLLISRLFSINTNYLQFANRWHGPRLGTYSNGWGCKLLRNFNQCLHLESALSSCASAPSSPRLEAAVASNENCDSFGH